MEISDNAEGGKTFRAVEEDGVVGADCENNCVGQVQETAFGFLE